MKTVGEFKKAGVVFVGEDEYIPRNSPTKVEILENKYAEYINTDWVTHNHWSNAKIHSFAWRDLTTKPDNLRYKIEVDTNNHCWRPSLNQGVEQRVSTAQVKQPEFKVGDLVVADCDAAGKYLIEIKYLDSHSVFGYLQSNDGQPPTLNYFCAYISNIKLIHYNPKLDELKDIIGTHDDPTECAKAILAAGYKK